MSELSKDEILKRIRKQLFDVYKDKPKLRKILFGNEKEKDV